MTSPCEAQAQAEPEPGGALPVASTRRLRASSIGVAVLLAVALIGPFLASDYRVFQFTQILVYAIALLGLNLLTGFSGQISLGNGAFYALGAYVSVILMTKAGVPYWLTPPVAGLVSFVVGTLFGRSVARLEGIYLALATFALAIAMPTILKLDALEKYTGGSQGIVLSKPASPFPGVVGNDQWLYFFCLAVAIAIYVVAWNLVRGRTGRALLALRDQPIAAGTMGVDLSSYKSIAFGVSAMYTGIAGCLGALVAGFISPDSFTIFVSIQFLVGAVVGGIASIFGTLFGAIFIQIVPDIANRFSPAAPAVLYGVLLIACMMVMPGGLAGLVHSARFRLARTLIRRTRT